MWPKHPPELPPPPKVEAQRVEPPPPPPKAEAQRVEPPPPPKVEPATKVEPPPRAERPIAVSSPRMRSHDDAGAKGRALSPEAAADLEQAEAALGAGNAADAIRLAQHSLYAQKSSRAYAVMVRARCAQGDLGNAKAAFTHVDHGDRGAVERECHKKGIELR
jgi:hypothetical protein